MRITFCGEITPTPYSEKNFTIHSNAFDGFSELIDKTDRLFAVVASPFSKAERPAVYRGRARKSSPLSADFIKRSGFTDIALAGPHLLDYGKVGLEDTFSALERNALPFFGAGRNIHEAAEPYRFGDDSCSVSVIAVSDGCGLYQDPKDACVNVRTELEVLSAVRSEKERGATVVLLYGGGAAGSPYPSPRVFEFCTLMAESGADVVICTGSECIGGYIRHKGAHILFGQGPAHFIKRGESPCIGMAMTYDTDTRKAEFRALIPDHASARVRLSDKQENSMAVDYMKKCGSLLKGADRFSPWRQYCEAVREIYSHVLLHPGDTEEELREEQIRFLLGNESTLDIVRELLSKQS